MKDVQDPADMSGGERIGKAMNFYRRQSRLSQQTVADFLSVPYQTYRKYEKGIDPVPRGRLSAFLQHLKIPLAEFRATLDDIHAGTLSGVTEGVTEETLRLIDSFAGLTCSQRKDVLDMVRVMVEKEKAPEKKQENGLEHYNAADRTVDRY